jgi:hypothetical protein
VIKAGAALERLDGAILRVFGSETIGGIETSEDEKSDVKPGIN